MPGAKIKILLIEDSGFMRIFISDILRHDAGIEIIGTATNGLDGVERAKSLKPDVVITDMVMPGHDGLYVVRQIMKEMPLPIILLSSLDRADSKIFDALKEGAFDFIDKPKDINAGGYPELLKMVREASSVDSLKLKKGIHHNNTSSHTFEARLNYDILAIGASTGGPSAVEAFINNLPSNLSIPVVIVQHMPDRFIESFVARIADVTQRKIVVATEGNSLLPNCIYLAPGFTNMKVVRSISGSPIIKFVADRYREYNHPSIDCFFESVAEVYAARAIGVVLTGMGRDGTLGLKKIHAGGGLTIAQDEATSVVYGMPKSAFESGAAKHKISLSEIPNFIISAL